MTPEKPRHDGEWVSVPREPTPEMIHAGHSVRKSTAPTKEIYEAMLAASSATPALGTHEGEPLLNELVRLRSDVARLPELEAHIRELENLTASHARTIEALRAVADQIGRVQPSNWLTESDDYRRGASDTILRYEPLIRALKHPNG